VRLASTSVERGSQRSDETYSVLRLNVLSPFRRTEKDRLQPAEAGHYAQLESALLGLNCDTLARYKARRVVVWQEFDGNEIAKH